uniref:BTB domain-containing protein n=1 Tax=Panagrolaimus davidi TaxID=227884 RepID=A0A914R2L8_9BILA
MDTTENTAVSNSRKLSFTGSMSSQSSSIVNVEDGTVSLGEESRWLSMNKADFTIPNSPLPSSFGSASDVSEVETVVDSDSEGANKNVAENSLSLRDQFFNALQDVFKKQNPTDSLFDIIFMVENKEIYAHMLILRLCGATKLIKYIEENVLDKNNKKVDMNIVDGNQLTFDDLYIFVKSIYFNNVENDLTPSNVFDWATKNAIHKKGDSLGAVYREILGEALKLIPFEEMNPNHIFEIEKTGILTSDEGMSYLKDILAKKEEKISSSTQTDMENYAISTSMKQSNGQKIDEIFEMADPVKPITKYLFKAMEN